MKNRPLIASYYFPNWHVDPRNEKLHGTGWTEWNVTRCALPRFPGHVQPKTPIWGYEDESVPTVMERKIEAAANHGIDAFLFDWYYYPDGSYRERCLNEGFLKAANRDRIKFAIMWANENPVLAHPRSWKTPSDFHPWNGETDAETFRAATGHCIDTFMREPNYLRIGDGAYFELYCQERFVKTVGGMETSRALVREFRDRVEKAGLGKLTFCGNFAGLPDGRVKGIAAVNDFCRALGLDMTASYGGAPYDAEFPAADYFAWQSYLFEARHEFYSDRLELPYNPHAQAGWDSSPRTVASDVYEKSAGYPYNTVLINDTPEAFEKILRRFRENFESGRFKGPILNLSCWNEWTEGAYLEPDAQYGYGKLEAVKRVFGKQNDTILQK